MVTVERYKAQFFKRVLTETEMEREKYIDRGEGSGKREGVNERNRERDEGT